MAISQYYCDPSIGGDSGTGTSGNPYGDLQYALNQITRNSTDGDQINIKSGTDEVLSAALSTASYGTPTDSAPLIFRGYTSVAGDGGIGGISGAGSYSLFATTTLEYIVLWDLHIHNSGSVPVVDLDRHVHVINCEINNSSDDGLELGAYGTVIGCYIHDCGALGADVSYASLVTHCYFKNDGTNDFTYAVDVPNGGVIQYSIIDIDGASGGVNIAQNTNRVMNNIIYSNGGTGIGVNAPLDKSLIYSNYIEGFSGTGGKGINVGGNATMVRNNRYYNNTTHSTMSSSVVQHYDNTVLSSSALADPSNGDFSVDGQLRGISWPNSFPEIGLLTYREIGAVQRKEQLRLPRLRGHGL